jgi:hypothetical protein
MSDVVHLKWKLESGEFPAEEVKREGVGGTDAMVLISIRRGPKAHHGHKSMLVMSVDGYTNGECPDSELFQALSALAKRVADGREAPLWQREMCRGFFEAVRAEVTGRASHS